MHAQACVCTPFYLCSRHFHVRLWPPLGTVKTYQERKHAPQASLYHLPHLSLSLSGFGFGFFFFFGNSCVCWHPAVLSHLGSHLLLLIKLGLLLAPVLLEWWSVSGSTMVPWVLPVGLRGTGRHAMYFIKSQTLLTFGYQIFQLLTRLRVNKIMPVNLTIEFLDCWDQSQWFVGLDEEHCLLPDV